MLVRGMPCQVGDQRLELVAVDVTAGEQQALPLPLESALRQQCLQYPLLALDSTDRRNSLSISLCRCFVPQRLTWPFVELARHGIQLRLRDIGQIDPLREVLP